MTVPFEPRRFESTVPFYLRYRTPYPDRLIAFVAEACGVTRGSRVLDLGCGPGQLAVGFARRGASVVAMDPEPNMLAAARETAAEAGVDLTLVEGSSYDLGPALGALRLVTMGRSFHWMDRDATLAALDDLVVADGAVVLFGERRIAPGGGEWRKLLEALQEEFVPEQMALRRLRRMEEEPHEVVLLRSPFSALERHGVVVVRHLGVDDIVGRAYSTSVASPHALGPRRGEFEAALRDGLARLSPSGTFDEIVEVTALIARRAP